MKNRLPTEIPASLKGVDIKALLRKRGIYEKQKTNRELKLAAKPLAKLLLKPKATSHNVKQKSRHAQFTDEVVQSYWEKQIRLVDVIEQHFENKLVQFIDDVQKGFLRELDSEVENRKQFAKFVQKDFFSEHEDDLLVQAQIDFAPLLDNLASLAGQEANKLIGIKTPYLTIKMQKQIRENVTKFTKSMLDTDRDTLINLITNGLQEGRSIPEIRGAIVETFNTYSKTQAQRITRTEVIRVSNQAAVDAFEQSGVVEGKQWLTFGAVDECAKYEGKIIELRDSFYSSENEFEDGDPPLHPNCRCVVLPVVVDEKAYVPSNEKLYEKIEYLESLVDKRTKSWKELKKLRADDKVYIQALEKHVGVFDEPPTED